MRSTCTLSVIVATFVLMGCGKDREPYKAELVQVTGTVKLEDKPLADATVSFAPLGSTKGLGAKGKTDANGQYTLETPFGSKGILPGEYKVTVSKMVDAKTGQTVTMDSLGKSDGQLEITDVVPPQALPKMTVPAGGGTIDIPLK